MLAGRIRLSEGQVGRPQARLRPSKKLTGQAQVLQSLARPSLFPPLSLI